jgi:hypothetical protein
MKIIIFTEKGKLKDIEVVECDLSRDALMQKINEAKRVNNESLNLDNILDYLFEKKFFRKVDESIKVYNLVEIS